MERSSDLTCKLFQSYLKSEVPVIWQVLISPVDLASELPVKVPVVLQALWLKWYTFGKWSPKWRKNKYFSLFSFCAPYVFMDVMTMIFFRFKALISMLHLLNTIKSLHSRISLSKFRFQVRLSDRMGLINWIDVDRRVSTL